MAEKKPDPKQLKFKFSKKSDLTGAARSRDSAKDVVKLNEVRSTRAREILIANLRRSKVFE